MKKSVVLLFVLVALTACTQHHMAAEIGGYEVHVIQSYHAFAPGSTSTLIYDKKEDILERAGQGYGPGIFQIAATPVATVTAAHEIGKGLRSSGDQINETTTNNNTTSSLSEGSSAKVKAAATGGAAQSYPVSISGAAAQSQSSPIVNTQSSAGASAVSNGTGDGWIPPGQR